MKAGGGGGFPLSPRQSREGIGRSPGQNRPGHTDAEVQTNSFNLNEGRIVGCPTTSKREVESRRVRGV